MVAEEIEVARKRVVHADDEVEALNKFLGLGKARILNYINNFEKLDMNDKEMSSVYTAAFTGRPESKRLFKW